MNSKEQYDEVVAIIAIMVPFVCIMYKLPATVALSPCIWGRYIHQRACTANKREDK